MAVKIRLLRMGKIRNPQYRIVVADSRTKRDGRAIEFVGIYHPKEDPSLIEVNSERVQYWLSVGAQPSEAVQRLLEQTGDWQKFKGLPAPPPLKVAAAARRPQGGVRGRGEGRRRPGRDRAKPAARPPRREPRPPKAEAEPRPEAEAAEGRGRRRPRPAGRGPGRGGRRCRRRRAGLTCALRPALEHLVKGIVDHPDDVRVRMVDSRRGQRLEVRVHPEDLGTVIGRGGPHRQGAAPGDQLDRRRGVRVDIVDSY